MSDGEREGEKHQCVVVSHVLPTRDLAHNPGMCPDWESNWRPFGFQASTPSTEPHQPGQEIHSYLRVRKMPSHISSTILPFTIKYLIQLEIIFISSVK